MLYAQFQLRHAAEAVGVPPQTIKNWLEKDHIVGHRDKISGGGGRGMRREFSFFNVMEMAVAQALVVSGIRNLITAFDAASAFAHAGSGPLLGHPARVPSCPFPPSAEGLTILAVGGGTSRTILHKPGTDFFTKASHAVGHPEVFHVVNINTVFDRVVRSLGADPRDVLDEAYEKNLDS